MSHDEHEHYDAHGDTEWACGGDSDCTAIESEPDCAQGFEHRWTSRGTGGCNSNPGVWSLGGTTYRYRVRCVLCGCERTTTEFGSQRDPGQCDTVRYEYGEQTLLDTIEARAEVRRQKRNARQRERRRIARLTRSTPAHA